jgi:micrococcal nuclease
MTSVAPRVILTAILFLPGVGSANDLAGRVIGVSDGDTMTVLVDRSPVKVRLNGIDAPERGQAFGARAKQFASELAFGREVTVREYGLDKYGRMIGDVFLADGGLLNQERGGLAWWYRKYAPTDTTLEKLEVEARSDKRGLWADANPIPPWAYRKLRRGEKKLDASDLVLFGTELPQVLPRGPPTLGSVLPDISAQPSLSRSSATADCPSYSAIAPRNQVPFTTIEQAEAAGYRQAKNCP